MNQEQKQVKVALDGLKTLQQGIDGVLKSISAEQAQILLKGLAIKLNESREDIVKHEKLIKGNSGKTDLIKYFDAIIRCQGEITMSKSLCKVIEKGIKDD